MKSNEDMILALAGQFKQLSYEPEKFRWLNGIRTHDLCDAGAVFQPTELVLSCCNSQSATLILGNKPIRLRESYIQRLIFLCVTILVALSKRTFSLTLILWQRIILCSKFVVDFLGCAQRFNNIFNTVMMQTVVRKSTYHTKPHSISQINVADYIQEINIYIYWYEYDMLFYVVLT